MTLKLHIHTYKEAHFCKDNFEIVALLNWLTEWNNPHNLTLGAAKYSWIIS